MRGKLPPGEFARVKIIGHTDYDLIAEPCRLISRGSVEIFVYEITTLAAHHSCGADHANHRLRDRANVTLALTPKVSTMMKDLFMDDQMKGQAVGLFFFGYVLLQIPCGHWATRWSARKVISLCLVGWGVCAVACGLARTFRQFEAARFLLGVAESGVFPPCWCCWPIGSRAQNGRTPTPTGISATHGRGRLGASDRRAAGLQGLAAYANPCSPAARPCRTQATTAMGWQRFPVGVGARPF